jgi:hypothetical protein
VIHGSALLEVDLALLAHVDLEAHVDLKVDLKVDLLAHVSSEHLLGRVQLTPMFPCQPVGCPRLRLTILVHKGSRPHEKRLSTVLPSAIHRFHEARSCASESVLGGAQWLWRP